MAKEFQTFYHSPIGWLAISGRETGVGAILYAEAPGEASEDLPDCARLCVVQLKEYFGGRRKVFSVPLLLGGTEFQRSVWQQLLTIEFGATSTYRQLADAIGNPKACRAVGHANGSNRLNIVVPCHRVIGADGSLTGYGGGLWRKEWLLRHEKATFKA